MEEKNLIKQDKNKENYYQFYKSKLVGKVLQDISNKIEHTFIDRYNFYGPLSYLDELTSVSYIKRVIEESKPYVLEQSYSIYDKEHAYSDKSIPDDIKKDVDIDRVFYNIVQTINVNKGRFSHKNYLYIGNCAVPVELLDKVNDNISWFLSINEQSVNKNIRYVGLAVANVLGLSMVFIMAENNLNETLIKGPIDLRYFSSLLCYNNLYKLFCRDKGVNPYPALEVRDKFYNNFYIVDEKEGKATDNIYIFCDDFMIGRMKLNDLKNKIYKDDVIRKMWDCDDLSISIVKVYYLLVSIGKRNITLKDIYNGDVSIYIDAFDSSLSHLFSMSMSENEAFSFIVQNIGTRFDKELVSKRATLISNIKREYSIKKINKTLKV